MIVFFRLHRQNGISTLNVNLLQHVFNIKSTISLPLKRLLINNALEYNA